MLIFLCEHKKVAGYLAATLASIRGHKMPTNPSPVWQLKMSPNIPWWGGCSKWQLLNDNDGSGRWKYKDPEWVWVTELAEFANELYMGIRKI